MTLHPERGRLLFRLKNRSRGGDYLVAALAVLCGIPWLIEAYRHAWSLDRVLLALAYPLMFGAASALGRRQVAFYENGIFFPQEPSGARQRFIPWTAIERYHWDGDVLAVVPSSSILSTGSAEPLTGGSIKVPLSRRVEAENLLARVPSPQAR